MPPKSSKLTTSMQSLIQSMASTASSPAHAASPMAGASASAGTASVDISALKSELIRAVITEMQTILDDHHSKLRSELTVMKAEIMRDFAALKTEFGAIKNTVSGIEHALLSAWRVLGDSYFKSGLLQEGREIRGRRTKDPGGSKGGGTGVLRVWTAQQRRKQPGAAGSVARTPAGFGAALAGSRGLVRVARECSAGSRFRRNCWSVCMR
ncbi:hypothetical protein SRHO_G00010730 [Serrasalmus rhombeus]